MKTVKGVICANCVYFSRLVSDKDWGYCKFNPPTVSRIQEGAVEDRPKVMFDDWCGRYKEKKRDTDRGQ